MKKSNQCSVCLIPIEDTYCQKCGQKSTKEPVTTRSLITDFFSNFFSLERSVLATIIKLIKDPHWVVSNYYNGFKNYYSSPGKILLYGIAIAAIHASYIDNSIMGVLLGEQDGGQQYIFWVPVTFFLLLISYSTFAVVERKFSKHLISVSYVASSWFILLIILYDLLELCIPNFEIGIPGFMLFIFLVFHWNSRVLTKTKKPTNIWINTMIQTIIFVIFILLLNALA